MLATSRRSAAASARAAGLASAAQASITQSSLSPPPAPVPTSAWMTPEATPEEADDSTTAAQKRLSMVGRAAKWQQTPGPRAMPKELSHAVQDLIRQGDRKLLKEDLRRSLAGQMSSSDIKAAQYSSRGSLLHMARHSPAKYASIRQVLETTALRLGEPSTAKIGQDGQLVWEEGWKPSRVAELGCGAGEGAWAAAETWPVDLREWHGMDASGQLIKTARELFAKARATMSDESVAAEELHPITSVKTHLDCTKSARDVKLRADHETLVLSAYQLLSLASDHAREQYVKRLWRSGAETIVLIEEGSDRGFAAIASARALLLELGEQDRQSPPSPPQPIPDFDLAGREKIKLGGIEFYEERPSDRSTQPISDAEEVSVQGQHPTVQQRGCWVVAPCPHDRPCPLLHPFELMETHKDAPVDSSSKPSAHHQAAHVGLTSCHHPVRLAPPRWARDSVADEARRQKNRGGREERSARISYVVVKRGQRPSFGEVLSQESQPSRQQREMYDALVDSAVEARRGILDELRQGDSVPRRHPEDIVGESASDFQSGLDGEDASAAREELLALLPAELSRAMQGSGETAEAQAAALEQAMAALQSRNLSSSNDSAEDVWKATSELSDDLTLLDEGNSAEVDAQEQNEAFLSSALQQQGDLKDGHAEVGSAPMAAEEASAPDSATILGAASLLVPSLPRIVLPPIKKGGHVTFDACHPSGSIQRYTIARSSGRQPYQEARKSAWSDQWGQDPVEKFANAADFSGSTTDKRKGWGQWPRISSADAEGGVKEEAASSKITSKAYGYPHPKTTTPRASHRASAYIGADQVSPQGANSDKIAAKDKSRSRRAIALKASKREKRGGRRGRDDDAAAQYERSGERAEQEY
ncbi:unnamed protein product [Parajaminaea phylloscopi]